MEEEQIVDVFTNEYPCACGHCTECGLNFVATPEELLRWEAEDGEFDYHNQSEWSTPITTSTAESR